MLGYPPFKVVGAWRSLASALAWGARGHGFKSRRSDQFSPQKTRGKPCNLPHQTHIGRFPAIARHTTEQHATHADTRDTKTGHTFPTPRIPTPRRPARFTNTRPISPRMHKETTRMTHAPILAGHMASCHWHTESALNNDSRPYPPSSYSRPHRTILARVPSARRAPVDILARVSGTARRSFDTPAGDVMAMPLAQEKAPCRGAPLPPPPRPQIRGE